MKLVPIRLPSELLRDVFAALDKRFLAGLTVSDGAPQASAET